MALTVPYRRKHALVIGIDKYLREPLKYCKNDAEDLANGLRRIDFKVMPGIDCTRDEFYTLIDNFTAQIGMEDLVLFYFAGHGNQSNDENYLLPSTYNYDHRATENEYITENAVNAKHIMKKIEDRKCRTAIYLFDCCRIRIRTRAMNTEHDLSFMHPKGHILIVYACAPGKAVQDETYNNRNGSFMENLLRHVSISNKDVEGMMRDVAIAVALQTNNFQIMQRVSSLTQEVFLVTNPVEGKLEISESEDELVNCFYFIPLYFLTVEIGKAKTVLPPVRNAPPKERYRPIPSEQTPSGSNCAPITTRTNLPFPQRPTGKDNLRRTYVYCENKSITYEKRVDRNSHKSFRNSSTVETGTEFTRSSQYLAYIQF